MTPSTSGPSPAAHGAPRAALALLAALATIAALKVVLAALSFPLFGHMDELPHVDVVMRYAAGEFPLRDGDGIGGDVIAVHEMWSSPEFGLEPGPDGPAPVNGQLPWPSADARRDHIERAAHRAAEAVNHEAYEPPPYYALAAGWLQLGRACGLDERMQVYWLRSLGGLALAIATIFGALFLRELVPDQPLIWLGAAVLTVAWPQDVVYFANNDVLNIALFPFCLWLVARMAPQDRPTIALSRAVLTGGVVGVGVMTKGTSLPLLIAASALLAGTAWRALRGERRLIAPLLTFGLCAVLPTAAWQAATYAYTGTVGATHKLSALTITPRPWTEWGDHPLFSLDGLWTYTSHLARFFWRGELRWHGSEMRHASLDAVWLGSLLVFGTVSLVATVLRRRSERLSPRLAATAWLGALSGVGILMLLSISHDYGGNQYPSQDFPYFTSGRLLGGLFPLVAALWLDGLRRCLGWLGPKAPWVAVAFWVVIWIASEAALMAPVVSSPHNVWNLNV